MVRSTKAKEKGFEKHFSKSFKTELKVPFKEDQTLIEQYLREVRNRSDFAYRNQKSVLTDFFEFINKPISSITRQDIRSYFNERVDAKEIKMDSKNTYRSYLSSFFEFICSIYLDIPNPVPNKKQYQFTQRSIDIKKRSEEKDSKVLTKQQLQQILNHCYYSRSLREFIFFGLCICTGARYSEIRTIKIENVNIEQRYFETGFEKNAKKSTRTSKRSLIFFFPENFKPFLQNYVFRLSQQNHAWLFASKKDQTKHVSHTGIQYLYEKIRTKLGFHFSMHYFRHSFITYLKRNDCSRETRETLLNHVPSGTQAKHYEHDEIFELKAEYDKYFPYYDISYY